MSYIGESNLVLSIEDVHMVIRKAFRITFILALVMSLLGTGMVQARSACSGSCCVQPRMQGVHDVSNSKDPGPINCCCKPSGVATDFTQGCPIELPVFADIAVSRAENPAPTTPAAVANNLHIPLEFSGGSPHKAWTLGMGPPVPLFLLNLSLLC